MNILVAPRAHSHKWVLYNLPSCAYTLGRITQINDSKDLLSVKIAIMQSEISHTHNSVCACIRE